MDVRTEIYFARTIRKRALLLSELSRLAMPNYISDIRDPAKIFWYAFHIPTLIVYYAASSEDVPGIEHYLQAISLLKGDEPCGLDFW